MKCPDCPFYDKEVGECTHMSEGKLSLLEGECLTRVAINQLEHIKELLEVLIEIHEEGEDEEGESWKG